LFVLFFEKLIKVGFSVQEIVLHYGVQYLHQTETCMGTLSVSNSDLLNLRALPSAVKAQDYKKNFIAAFIVTFITLVLL